MIKSTRHPSNQYYCYFTYGILVATMPVQHAAMPATTQRTGIYVLRKSHGFMNPLSIKVSSD